MKESYLAIDIGASGGRHIIGFLENGKLKLQEIYRFQNGIDHTKDGLVWDTRRLFQEILTGMRKCHEAGFAPVSMGIDTWAVDYVLLDGEDRMIGPAYAYRDRRTEGMDHQVYQMISEEELYRHTGIQKQSFNTIYQLMSVEKYHPEWLEQARTFLMLPDYFHYLLTGVKMSEYTNATSTQLVNVQDRDWDRLLIGSLGYPQELFLPLRMPGSPVGGLKPEIVREVGFDCRVVLPASHDTASAVMAVPAASDTEELLYISSGTWSLMGIETKTPICTEESRCCNFTNEGGYEYRYRYLKNIMGLWMIQSVRHEWQDRYSFAQLCVLAEEEREFPSRVDVNDQAFLAPESMTEAIRQMCRRTGQPAPETPGQIATVIYQSLAESYRDTLQEIETLTGKYFGRIHIIGGGSHADYLNRLTAEKTGRSVWAGPGEATAVGNLTAQMIADGRWPGLGAARRCVQKSFEIKKYE